MARPRIPFFIDNCVPNAVGEALALQGHDVVLMRNFMPQDSGDPFVALTAWTNGRVLVSHDNDFKGVARRLDATQRSIREKMHRIDLRCVEPDSARRVTEAMGVIELEWQRANQVLQPMIVEIKDAVIRLLR